MIRASGSTRRLVDRLALDPARLGKMLTRRFGFTRRDIALTSGSRRPATVPEGRGGA